MTRRQGQDGNSEERHDIQPALALQSPSEHGEGGEGGMSQEDNYPPGMQHQNDPNGIESSIDQIFEGIISLSIIRVWFY